MAAFNPPFYANEHDFFEALTNDNEPNDQAAYRIICFDKRDYNFTEELNISQEMDDEQPEDNRAYQNWTRLEHLRMTSKEEHSHHILFKNIQESPFQPQNCSACM